MQLILMMYSVVYILSSIDTTVDSICTPPYRYVFYFLGICKVPIPTSFIQISVGA